MKEPRKHYLVEFASRYAGARFKTLNAGSALWRAESLVHDAAALLELKNDAEAKEVRFGHRLGTYEVISYFAVAFVTCLEWHARSRLVDIMLFRPSCIESSDLKNIATLALSQMVAEGATIPHKWKLKKKEIIFGKELDAASEFIFVHQKIRPQYRHPDMDWDEALTDVAEELTDVESKLQNYRIHHGAILSSTVRKMLDACIEKASFNQYATHGHGNLDMKDAKKAAEQILETLTKIEEQLVKELRA